MRILVLTNLYPNPYQPNRATFNRQQIAALAASHEVRVIAPVLWTDELRCRRRQGNKLGPQRRTLCDEIPVEHPRYWYPPAMLRGSYGHCYAWSVKGVFNRAVESFSPDVVYAPWAYPDGWGATRLGHAAGLPVVIKVHGSDVLELGRHAARQARTVEALQAADRIAAVSEDLANKMQALGIERSKIDVHYCGIDASRFSPGCRKAARDRLGLGGETPIILFVGNLLPVKGLDILLEACARLRKEGQRFECHVLGEGPLRGHLEREVQRLELQETVRVQGGRPHEQLTDWFRAANVFALSSRSEGVPTVLLESLACGLPFVASRVGGIPEIAHLGPCTLVESEDIAGLAAALRGHLQEPGNMSPPAAPALRTHAEAAAELAQIFEGVVASYRTTTASAQAAIG